MSLNLPDISRELELNHLTAEGPLYRVIIHNDDVTPMDFVLYVLISIFQLAGVQAVQVMYTAHYHGCAYVQTIPQNEAQRRIHQAHMAARLQNFPLKFTMEPEH